MSRRRMIDPSYLNNPCFHQLDPADQMLAIGLVAAADDAGRGPADPRWIRAQAAPFSDDSLSEITVRLHRIATTLTNPNLFPGRLLVYEANGNAYFQWRDWDMFQSLDSPQDDGHPAPPGYRWVPDTSDRRRKRAGRWEPVDGTPQPERPRAEQAAVESDPDREPPREDHRSTPQAQAAPAAEPEEATQTPIRATPEYQEFEQFCLSNDLKPWLQEANFVSLVGMLRGTGRDWTVLLEVAREAVESASGKPPNMRYGRQIIANLPEWVRTREDARKHFDSRQGGGQRSPGPPDDGPPDDDDDPLAARARAQAAMLRQSYAAETS